MSDSILERLTGRSDDQSRKNDDQEMEDLQSFGWLRGVRDRAIMLELRHLNGNITCYGYAWLEKAEFDIKMTCFRGRGCRFPKWTSANFQSAFQW